MGVREESENNIIPHCLQRIGTSLARYFGLVFFVVVGWGRLVAQAPLEDWRGTAKARSLPSRSSLALITPSTTLMRRAAVRPSTRAINHSSVGFVYLIGWAEALLSLRLRSSLLRSFSLSASRFNLHAQTESILHLTVAGSRSAAWSQIELRTQAVASGHVTPHTVLCHHTPCTDNARTVKLRGSVIMALLNCFHMFRTLASLIFVWKNRVFSLLERCACHIYAHIL